MKKVVPVLILFCLGAAVLANPADGSVENILEQYFKVHAALADDSTDGVQDAAREIVSLASNSAAADPEVKGLLSDIKNAAEQIQGKDLKAARESFFDLSKPMLVYLNKYYEGKSEYPRYYCGMVNKAWVQSEKGVKNPYHGKSMLTCGELIK